MPEFVGCKKITIQILESIQDRLENNFGGIGAIIEERVCAAYMNGYAEALRKEGKKYHG